MECSRECHLKQYLERPLAAGPINQDRGKLAPAPVLPFPAPIVAAKGNEGTLLQRSRPNGGRVCPLSRQAGDRGQ